MRWIDYVRKVAPDRLTNDRAVSPVVGVALMVAVVVMLAAVVAAAVTGMGSSLEQAPQATIGFDYDQSDSSLALQHEGGDTLDNSSLVVKVNDPNDFGDSPYEDAFDSDISTGDEVELDVGTGNFTGDETVRIVWSDGNSEESAVLGEWQGPDA